MRLDAHQHFWKHDSVEYAWIKLDWPIRRDFLPQDLEPLLNKHGFDGSIVVQARQTPEETRWLLKLAERHAFIKGVVGWADLRSDGVEAELQAFATNPKFVGVRHVVQDEPDGNFMLRPDFVRGISNLESFDLTYDILIFPRQLPAAIALVKRFPRQRFVLDHIAKPSIKSGVLSPWREQIIELAKFPNVMCKLSGMVTEADWKKWKMPDFRPFVETVADAFGFDRLMFGSDWPVCLLAGSYEQALHIVQETLRGLSDSQKEAVLGGNAEKFYVMRQN